VYLSCVVFAFCAHDLTTLPLQEQMLTAFNLHCTCEGSVRELLLKKIIASRNSEANPSKDHRHWVTPSSAHRSYPIISTPQLPHHQHTAVTPSSVHCSYPIISTPQLPHHQYTAVTPSSVHRS